MRRSFLFVWWIFCSCGISLPSEFKIQDLRILDIRATPPEVRVFQEGQTSTDAGDLASLVPDLKKVKFQVLVAHPDLNATFSYDWIACKPGLRSVPCSSERVRLSDSPTDEQEVSPVEILLNELIESSNMDGAVSPIRNIYDFASNLLEDPRDLLDGLYTYINVRTEVKSASIAVDTPVLEGTKRVVLFDPLIVKLSILEARKQDLPVIEGLDLPDLCTQASPEALQDIFLYLDTRLPNQAPTYDSLIYSIRKNGVETATLSAKRGEQIQMGIDDQLMLKGRGKDGDKEDYRLIDGNCDLQSFQETLAFSWFTNIGSLSNQLTTDGKDERRGRRTTYTPSSIDEETSKPVRIWSVLRDGRGGSDWWSIDVAIQ